MLLCKVLSEPLLDLLFHVLGWLNDTHQEGRRYAESKDAVNKGSHDLHVSLGLEEFLEVVITLVQKSLVASSHLLSQLGLQVLVGNVLVSVVLEFLADECVLFQYTAEVNDLLRHDSHSEKLVSIVVLMTQVLVTSWHNSWQLHHLIVLCLCLGEVGLDCLFSNGIVIDVLVAVVAVELGSSLPVSVVGLVEVKQKHWVHVSELFDQLFVHNYQDGSED